MKLNTDEIRIYELGTNADENDPLATFYPYRSKLIQKVVDVSRSNLESITIENNQLLLSVYEGLYEFYLTKVQPGLAAATKIRLNRIDHCSTVVAGSVWTCLETLDTLGAGETYRVEGTANLGLSTQPGFAHRKDIHTLVLFRRYLPNADCDGAQPAMPVLAISLAKWVCAMEILLNNKVGPVFFNLPTLKQR
jgi:hypothetical protein